MSGSRRSFLRHLSGIAGSMSLMALVDPVLAAEAKDRIEQIESLSPEEAARDEDFWGWVRQSFTSSPTNVNFNNGGVSPQPKVVQDAQIYYNRLSNEAPAYFMWRVLDKGREALRKRLAKVAGCSPEEVAINRNTTEALDTIIFGLQLKKGDEIVLTRYDYPNMLNAWKQRAKRDGVVLKFVDIDLPSEDKSYMVGQFTKLFTARTKVVHITHMMNWNGQVLPVKEIAAVARPKGIDIMVDGAHSFAHLDFSIDDLGCDYFGTSLHKWLCAPFGTGMLYVRKEKIKSLWPTFPNHEPDSDRIQKFEGLGTRSFAAEFAVAQAIDFHELIGIKRKNARLYFLKNYWVSQVKDLPGVTLKTPNSPEFSGALATFEVEGLSPISLNDKLLREHHIIGSPVRVEAINGVRITPHIYSSIDELDRLVAAIKELVA